MLCRLTITNAEPKFKCFDCSGDPAQGRIATADTARAELTGQPVADESRGSALIWSSCGASEGARRAPRSNARRACHSVAGSNSPKKLTSPAINAAAGTPSRYGTRLPVSAAILGPGVKMGGEVQRVRSRHRDKDVRVALPSGFAQGPDGVRQRELLGGKSGDERPPRISPRLSSRR